MKSPIDIAMDQVEFKETGNKPEGDMPYATHEGLLKIGDLEFKCYRLSTGQSVIDSDDFNNFLGGIL